MIDIIEDIEDNISVLKQELSDKQSESMVILDEFRYALAPNVDTAKERYNDIVKDTFHISKAIKHLKKARKSLLNT